MKVKIPIPLVGSIEEIVTQLEDVGSVEQTTITNTHLEVIVQGFAPDIIEALIRTIGFEFEAEPHEDYFYDDQTDVSWECRPYYQAIHKNAGVLIRIEDGETKNHSLGENEEITIFYGGSVDRELLKACAVAQYLRKMKSIYAKAQDARTLETEYGPVSVRFAEKLLGLTINFVQVR